MRNGMIVITGKTQALTKDLAEMRVEARSVYSGARWLPGDECPVETAVSDGLNDYVLVGESRDPEFAHWWRGIGAKVPEGCEILLWPPMLREVDSSSVSDHAGQ